MAPGAAAALGGLAGAGRPGARSALQLYDRDTGVCEYPLKAELARRLQLGQLPLWIPWSEAGTSMLAQMTPGLFHP